MGILAAYAHRLKTGEGQRVETSLLEAGIVHTYWQSAIALASGVAAGPMGSAHPLNAPYQAFETEDGWIVIGGDNRATGCARWRCSAPRSWPTTRASREHARMAHLKELEAASSPPASAHATRPSCWPPSSRRACRGPVYDVLQTQADPQMQAREMVVEVEHSALGPVKTVGLPVKFSETPGDLRRGAPRYGEHTREVLREAGFDDRQIDAFEREGAITTASTPGARQAAGSRPAFSTIGVICRGRAGAMRSPRSNTSAGAR